MLQRLLLRFEAGEAASVAQTSPTSRGRKDAGTTLPTISHVVKRCGVAPGGDEPFDRAGVAWGCRWTVADSPSRTGTAPKGCTSCRYLDPDYRASNARGRA